MHGAPPRRKLRAPRNAVIGSHREKLFILFCNIVSNQAMGSDIAGRSLTLLFTRLSHGLHNKIVLRARHTASLPTDRLAYRQGRINIGVSRSSQ